MSTRTDLVRLALRDNGYLNGAGYDGPNRFSAGLSLPPEAWCGDTITSWFRANNTPLPSMQPGHQAGYSYCPSAVAFGLARSIVIPSWTAKPGDIVLFDWDGNGIADHTELVTGWWQGVLYTIGGNSGPSNVDGYRGAGGVHRHAWMCPQGAGNSLIQAVLDVDRLVWFHPGNDRYANQPVLSLGSKGRPVVDLQIALDIVLRHESRKDPQHLTADGDFGPLTDNAVRALQDFWLNHDGKHPEHVDGQVGPLTWAVLGALQTSMNR